MIFGILVSYKNGGAPGSQRSPGQYERVS